MLLRIPKSLKTVASVASIVVVVFAYKAVEVLYLPETSVVRFKTSARFELPPTSVAFLISTLLVSSSNVAEIPAFDIAVSKSAIVMPEFKLTVIFCPFTLNIALPFDKPNVPSVVFSLAIIVVVTACRKAFVLALVEDTLV